MKRPTRVPASTVVRMNRASNMIAKWYQNALRASPPNAREDGRHADGQGGRAAGAGDQGLLLDLLGRLELVGGDGEAEVGDRLEADWTVVRPPLAASSWRRRPWSRMDAATMAMTATNDSVSMAP